MSDKKEAVKGEVPVKVVRVYVSCPDDGGTLKSAGYSHPTAPPIYPHFCETCGQKFNLGKTYPAIEYR